MFKNFSSIFAGDIAIDLGTANTLIWVKGKADILQASAIISNVNDSILLRKFILFNKSDQPDPRAGFYVSVLED